MADNYEQSDDGEMEEWVPDTDYFVACCDCGLIHRIQVSKPVTVRWSLESAQTAKYRVKHKRDLVCSVKRRRKTT